MLASLVHSPVLQLDIQGPQAWISAKHAAVHFSSGSIAWVIGDAPLRVLHGGYKVGSGQQSVLEAYPIFALRGASSIDLIEVVPAISRSKLFRRDRDA